MHKARKALTVLFIIVIMASIVLTERSAAANPDPGRRILKVNCADSADCPRLPSKPKRADGLPWRLEDLIVQERLGISPEELALMVDETTDVAPNLASGAVWLICPGPDGKERYWDPKDLRITHPDQMPASCKKYLRVGVNRRWDAPIAIYKKLSPCQKGVEACNAYVARLELDRTVAALHSACAGQGLASDSAGNCTTILPTVADMIAQARAEALKGAPSATGFSGWWLVAMLAIGLMVGVGGGLTAWLVKPQEQDDTTIVADRDAAQTAVRIIEGQVRAREQELAERGKAIDGLTQKLRATEKQVEQLSEENYSTHANLQTALDALEELRSRASRSTFIGVGPADAPEDLTDAVEGEPEVPAPSASAATSDVNVKILINQFRRVHATLRDNLERIALVVADPKKCNKKDRQAARAALECAKRATEQLGTALAA